MKIENLYKYLLFLLIFLLPLGSRFNVIEIFNINFYAFRIALLISFFILVINKNAIIPTKGFSKWISIFLAYLIFFGSISIIWVENKMYAITQVSYLVWGGISFVVLFSFYKNTKDFFKIIIHAATLSTIILAAFGLFEIITYAHLDSSFTDNYSKYFYFRSFFQSPLATFTNPNDFAAYLSFIFVFFIIKAFKYSNKVFSFVFLIIIYLLVFYTYSSLSVIAIYYSLIASLLMLIFSNRFHIIKANWKFLRHHVRYKEKYNYRFFIIALFIFSTFFVLYTNKMIVPYRGADGINTMVVKEKKSLRISLGDQFSFTAHPGIRAKITDEPEGVIESSFSVRKNLFLNGIDFAKESYFLGIGAGQFDHKIVSGQANYPTKDRFNPHSFFVEILSQYGVIPIIIIVVFFSKILIFLLKNILRLYYTSLSQEGIFLALAVPVYFIVSNGPSAFFSFTPNWVFLSLIAIAADKVVNTVNHDTKL